MRLYCWKNNTGLSFGFRWQREPIKAFGIFFFFFRLIQSLELNLLDKILNLEKTFNSWKRRNLRFYRKINIVKSLELSNLTLSRGPELRGGER